MSALAATLQPMPTEQKRLTSISNSCPVLGDLRDYPRVNELDLVKSPDDYTYKPVCLDEMIVFDVHQDRGGTTVGIQSSSDDATMSGIVVYAGTIPDLANNFSIILGGYVVGTEADLVGDESTQKCELPGG